MNKLIKLKLLFLALSISFAASSENDSESSLQRMSQGNYAQVYTSSLHDEMSIIDRYTEGGVYYLRGEVNSFGEDEVINTQQEVIFCSGTDLTFTEVAKLSLSRVQFEDHDGLVIKDSASTGALPNQFISDLEDGLRNNGNSNAKGRFCYKVNNSDVSYFTAGSEDASHCEEGSSTGVFLDPVTSNRCELILDMDLKAGESRYIRQPEASFRTIAQGFVRCNDDGFGQPTLELIANPASCGTTSTSTCNYSCIWADGLACSGASMPRWGGGSCGGIGATLFRDDVININSSRALSFNVQSGLQYEGSAVMSCNQVGEQSVWVIDSSNCDVVDDLVGF
tara:strand:+ start:7480 stop:8490 length:1011 start_codon:yes stop_codon:yes gene_type:complete